jgi:SAM-dependent methyltransferase
MAPAPSAYTGIENLEVMSEAENYNRFLLSLITARLKPGDRVLDFGAGNGTFALPLQQRQVDILCVEPDPTLGTLLQRAGLRRCVDLGDIADGSIDFVYTFNVLEHIADDRGVVRLLAQKLTPGGRLLVYVPAFPLLFSAMDRKVGHLRRYRRRGLVSLLEGAGLRLREVRHVDSLGFAAALLFRAFGNDGGAINRTALRLYDRLIFPASRAVDRLSWRWLGKNLMAVAERDGANRPSD